MKTKKAEPETEGTIDDVGEATVVAFVPPPSCMGYEKHHKFFTLLQGLSALLVIALVALAVFVSFKLSDDVHPLWLGGCVALFVAGSTLVIIALMFGICSKRSICKREPQLQGLFLDFTHLMIYRIAFRVGMVVISAGLLSVFSLNFVLHGAQKDCHPVTLSLAGIGNVPHACSRTDMLAHMCGYTAMTWTKNKREGRMEDCYWMIAKDLIFYLDVLSIVAAVALLSALCSEIIASYVSSAILRKVAPVRNPVARPSSRPPKAQAVDLARRKTSPAMLRLSRSLKVSETSEAKPRSSRVLETKPVPRLSAASDSNPTASPDVPSKPLSRSVSPGAARRAEVIKTASRSGTRGKSKDVRIPSKTEKLLSKTSSKSINYNNGQDQERGRKKSRMAAQESSETIADEESKSRTAARRKRSRKSAPGPQTEPELSSPPRHLLRKKNGSKLRQALVGDGAPVPMSTTKKQKDSDKTAEPRAENGPGEKKSRRKSSARTDPELSSPGVSSSRRKRTGKPHISPAGLNSPVPMVAIKKKNSDGALERLAENRLAEAGAFAEKKRRRARSSATTTAKCSQEDVALTPRVHREELTAIEPGQKSRGGRTYLF